MAAEDVQFLNVFRGKRIKLTLKSSSYLGVVQRINLNKTLVLVDGQKKNFSPFTLCTVVTVDCAGFLELPSTCVCVLCSVVSCSNSCKIPGSKLFFGREIVNGECV